MKNIDLIKTNLYDYSSYQNIIDIFLIIDGLDNFSTEFVGILSEADQSIGVLKSLSKLIPNPNLLVAPYIRKEAVQSSRIEGTQASLSSKASQ